MDAPASPVAPSSQQKQIDDITNWLNGWSLTKGTTKKWWTVAGIYIAALVVTGVMTFWFSGKNNSACWTNHNSAPAAPC